MAGLWPGAVLRTGATARRSEAAAALSSARLVHLAAHGTHQAENPLFSSIRLVDGPIFAYELDDSAARGRARGAVGLRARSGHRPARR